MRMRFRALGAAVAAALSVVLLGPGTTASAAGDPPLTTPVATLAAAMSCPSTFSHPSHEPVLLVHGTGMTAEETWSWGYQQALTGAGFDVCTVDLPDYALDDIQISSEYVVYAIEQIHAETGKKVEVVGHSQGNLEMRWAAKWWTGVQNDTDDMVMLGNPAHGVAEGDLACVLPCAAAGTQFSIGSNFLNALNSGDETPGPISYTSVYSRTDELILPYTTAITSGATNVAVQDVCPGRVVTHGGLLYDSITYQLVLDALTHAGPADPGRLPFGTCLGLYLPGVTVANVAYVTDVLGPTALTRIATANLVWSEPPLMSYAL
jgi:triacylglycerol esterase/lipase EstA (alpha/beta hydrolase family)